MYVTYHGIRAFVPAEMHATSEGARLELSIYPEGANVRPVQVRLSAEETEALVDTLVRTLPHLDGRNVRRFSERIEQAHREAQR